MPWKANGVMEQRVRFVLEWDKQERNLAELCREYEISRQTGYTWLERYRVEGLEGLQNRSRAPHRHPNQVGPEAAEQVLQIRARYPLWGARKIRSQLARKVGSGPVPAASTIGVILRENGLTVPQPRRSRAPRRTAPLTHADGPNRVWCADFKGWFRTGDGRRCDPLTITDAYSRYLLRCQAVKAEDVQHSQPVFEMAFREFGLPERIRTDNGTPFGSNGETGLTALAVWWIKLGIWPERIRPGQPQENGRHERMHLTLKQATASPPASSWRQQQRRFDLFRQEYNQERPHEALGQVPPAEFYQPSNRPWPSRLPEVIYGPGQQVRRVGRRGQIKWDGAKIFVSHALAGEAVGLQQITPLAWRVNFSFYELGVLEESRTRLWTPEQWQKRNAEGA
jgi:putative transposase